MVDARDIDEKLWLFTMPEMTPEREIIFISAEIPRAWDFEKDGSYEEMWLTPYVFRVFGKLTNKFDEVTKEVNLAECACMAIWKEILYDRDRIEPMVRSIIKMNDLSDAYGFFLSLIWPEETTKLVKTTEAMEQLKKRMEKYG